MRIAGGRAAATSLQLLLALVALAGIHLPRAWAEELPDWMHPGVRVGANNLQKKELIRLQDIGVITDIKWGQLRRNQTSELGIAGNFGARLLNEDGELRLEVSFAVSTPGGFRVSASIVKETASSGLLFLRRAGAAATYDSVVDANGKEIWRAPGRSVNSVFGYVGPDDSPEFYFSRENNQLEARNVAGSLLWQTPDIGWGFGMVFLSANPNSQSEVLVGDGERLTAVGIDGRLLFSHKVAETSVFSDFAVAEWPSVCQECLVVSLKDKIVLLTTDGNKAVVELSPASYLAHVHAESIKLQEDASPCLAVVGLLQYQGGLLAGFKAVHAELYIFNPKGELIYDEVLPERVEALGVLPVTGSKRQKLLIGGENRVWEYSTADPRPPG